MTARVAGMLALACIGPGCGRGEPAGGDEAALRAALARANDLAARHRVAEALAAIDQVPVSVAGPTGSGATVATDVLERKARLLITLGRPREAVSILEDVARARPADAGARRWLARAALDAGDSARAVTAIEGLQGPAFLDALVDYGAALAAEGRTAEAATAAAAALVRDPWNEPAYLEMGRILVRAGREGEGATFLERYRKSDPFRRAEQEALSLEAEGSDARALLWRARMERERGRLFEAMDLANRAISKDSRLGEAYLELARISIFVAKPKDAVPILERLGPDPRALAILAEALDAAGDVARAAEARAAAAARGPAPAAQGPLPPSGGADSAAIKKARDEARDRISGMPLSRSVPGLLPLVRTLIDAQKADDARALALFLLRLAPSERAAVLAVIDAFDRPEDAFVRLWALASRREPDLAERFRAEAMRLGLDPVAVSGLLRGTPR